MILLEINNLKFYSGDTWNTFITSSWLNKSSLTWAEILNPTSLSNIGMLNNTFTLTDLIKDQSTASFTIFDAAKAYRFVKGNPVSIKDDSLNKVFAGYIDSVEEHLIGSDDNFALEHIVSCIDNTYLARKRKVIKAFENEKVTDCIAWILANILDDEGITLGLITDNPLTISKIFNYVDVPSVLDELADYINYTWFIDVNKKLYFIPHETYRAPINITYNSGVSEYIKYDSLKVVDGNPEYRNVQYIKGGYEKTDLQTEYKKGDGENQTFVVGYAIIEEPKVYVNSVEKTVGIKGVDTTEDWYWSKGDNTIIQKGDATKLTSSDTLKIEYYGKYAIVAKSLDYAAIAARAAIDGSSGKVEECLDDNSIVSLEACMAKANALLTAYAIDGKVITWQTEYKNLAVGQLIHITIPYHNLDHDCLISQIDMADEDGEITRTITAVSGPVEDYWVKFWANSAMSSRKAEETNVISDVLQIPITFTKTWLESEDPNIFKKCYPGASTFASDADWPCFEDGDEIKYIQFTTEDGYRRYRTSQTRTATKITTICIIPSNEANDIPWTSIKLFGGDLATEVLDSGINVTSHVHNYTKNILESLQLTFTDNKWECKWVWYSGEANALWRLNNNVLDSSGNGNTGTPTDITYVNGIFEKAAYFNGSTSFIEIPCNTYTKPNNFSIMCWYKGNGTNMTFVSNFCRYEEKYFGYILGSAGNVARIIIAKGTGLKVGTDFASLLSTTTINDNKWHHIGATYDGSTANIYIDGVLENSVSWISGLVYTTTQYPRIGRRQDGIDGYNQEFVNGNLCDIVIVDHVIDIPTYYGL